MYPPAPPPNKKKKTVSTFCPSIAVLTAMAELIEVLSGKWRLSLGSVKVKLGILNYVTPVKFNSNFAPGKNFDRALFNERIGSLEKAIIFWPGASWRKLRGRVGGFEVGYFAEWFL